LDLGLHGIEVTVRSRIAAGLLAACACAALPVSSYAAEAWLQPETLSTPGTYNDQADLVANAPGVAAVIWTEFANERTPRFRVRVATREPNGPWAASQQLSGAGEAGSGAVGVDPQGRTTAVWDEAGKMMWAIKPPGQPWTSAQAIPDGDGGNPDLFVASDGTETAVWQKGTTADTLVIRTARRPVDGAWSNVETISPTWSYRPHIEGDTAGDVSVSYTHDAGGGSQRYIYAVDRPNSGPWGAQTPIAGPAITDNISDLVVAPNSGLAAVFWQNGDLTAPMAARTRSLGTAWSAGTTTPISGTTAGRLDLQERDRAAVDGMGLVTAVWIAGKKVLTAYRNEPTGSWTAPATPLEIDPGDGTTALENVQIASNAFGRAVATWTAVGSANRYAFRGPGPGAPWSAPKPIDGVPADAGPLDLAVDGTGRVAYAWSARQGINVASLAISTYGDPLQSPQPPAPPGPAPPTNPPSPPGPGSAKAKLKGTATTARGVSFVVTMPVAGSAKITLFRAGGARHAVVSASKYRRVGVVRRSLNKGRNVITVKRIGKRKLPRGRYRATITATAAGQRLEPIRVAFTIRR
jgi:hypothetical protein